jgi:hypothetical protein
MGRLGIIDLPVLTTLDQLFFVMKILFALFFKTSYLNEEVNGTEPSPSDIVAWFYACKFLSKAGAHPSGVPSESFD